MRAIQVWGDNNETTHGRLAELAEAVNEDSRFSLSGVKSLVADLRFETDDWAMNVELKDFTGDANSDFVSSILSGHGWKQCRDMRSAGDECCFLVLGTHKDLRAAILKAADLKHRPAKYRKSSTGELIQVYSNRVKDFRRNCDCLGCDTYLVWEAPWFQDRHKNTWENLLQMVHKRSMGGDPYAHRPKWSESELEIGALIDMIPGLGKVRASEICKHYRLQLVPRSASSPRLEEIPGIGPKTIALLEAHLAQDAQG